MATAQQIAFVNEEEYLEGEKIAELKHEMLPPSSNQALTDSAIAYYQGGDYVLRHELLKVLPQKQ